MKKITCFLLGHKYTKGMIEKDVDGKLARLIVDCVRCDNEIQIDDFEIARVVAAPGHKPKNP